MNKPTRSLKAHRRRFFLRSITVAAIAAYSLAVPEAARSEAEAQAASPSVRLSQVWEEFQKGLDTHGIQLGVRYDGEAFANATGGLRRGGGYLGNLNLQVTADAERLVGWPGATVFIYGLGIHGGRPSKKFVGDAQGVSNIEAPAKWKLEEGWVQQNLFDNRFSALAGRYDLNSEFYRLQSAGLFLNSSFGIGAEFSQSGVEGPSIFPNTSVGARFAVKPTEQMVVRTAVLDGVPVERPSGAQAVFANHDGALIVTEAAYLYRPVGPEQPRTRGFLIGRNCCGAYRGKVAAGAWYYTASFDDLKELRPNGKPVRHRGSGGAYLIGDWIVYQDAKEPDRQATLFGQFGMADPQVNRFAYYTGGGATITALIPGRNQDQLGIGVAAAHNGAEFMSAQRKQGLGVERSEVALELTYL
ncbi:MAG TPA: carbohydrate porin, partial [Candidatus Binatia bacterium]|nr:carbohydrate porin [Candidatus Binatia bacterium]